MNQFLNYARLDQSKRAITGTAAAICSLAGLILGVTAFSGLLPSWWLAVFSLGLAVLGSILAIIALLMQARRNWVAILALVISLAYWVIIKYWLIGDPFH